ncbi:type II toxin-antitoxin system VapC family toxin [Streptomyces sp. MS2A]|nr:type II toxin-antitoxin system VapC family toxin [Streptomyces sp. MS2A]
MTTYLLDTHVLVWLATDPDRIPVAVRDEMTRAAALFASAASAFEIAQKARSGRLPHGNRILTRWDHLLSALLAAELPLSVDHMRAAGELDWEHRDPFDRMLVAQAQQEGLLLVTKDERILSFPEVTCLPWA